MKIGILTQPLGHNYGGVLQNWALQQILSSLGHDPLTINLRWSNKKSLYQHFRKSIFDRRDDLVEFLIRKPELITRLKLPGYPDLCDFVDSKINLSPNIYAPLNSSSLDSYEFDALIVGSDQVWRPSYSPCIENFFLDFIPDMKSIRKIAYAASFGNSLHEYSDELVKRCSLNLKKFHAVSVREDTSVVECGSSFGVTPKCVLDPTMIVSTEIYRDLVAKSDLAPIASNYGLGYFLDPDSSKINKFVDNCIQRHITPISLMPIDGAHNEHLLVLSPYPSVQKWLKLFMDASFVMTDSFHGTVFSVLFEKEFRVINNVARGADRITSLLKRFNITHKLLDYDNKHIVNENNFTSILENLRSESITFLRDSLK